MTKIVPNVFPKLHNQPYRIALIGEAPGKDEEDVGVPFVGRSGVFLNARLAKTGILRDACFIGNICQLRLPNNKIESFAWNGPEITEGRAILKQELAKFKPNICVLLGKTALRAAKETEDEFLKEDGETKKIDSITKWRGTLFNSESLGIKHLKCIPSLHPAACLRGAIRIRDIMGKTRLVPGTPLLTFDLQRAIEEGCFPELRLPQRNLTTNLSTEEIICELERIHQEKPTIAIDIEGGIDTMSCISIAKSAESSFIVPISGHGHLESDLWKSLATVLTDPTIPKILQNALYDTFVLQYSYNIPIRGIVDDIMLKHWE